jgi:biopolymer transport protein ExbD
LDMTPMVDLAFLLLTFFILATTLSKPLTMPLVMPEKSKEPGGLINPGNLMNLVLGGKNQLFWYIGVDASKAVSTTYSPNGIRKLLLAKQNNRKLWVFIKPTDASTYQNLVDALDEMAITGIRHYSVADASVDDQALKGSLANHLVH